MEMKSPYKNYTKNYWILFFLLFIYWIENSTLLDKAVSMIFPRPDNQNGIYIFVVGFIIAFLVLIIEQNKLTASSDFAQEMIEITIILYSADGLFKNVVYQGIGRKLNENLQHDLLMYSLIVIIVGIFRVVSNATEHCEYTGEIRPRSLLMKTIHYIAGNTKNSLFSYWHMCTFLLVYLFIAIGKVCIEYDLLAPDFYVTSMWGMAGLMVMLFNDYYSESMEFRNQAYTLLEENV